MKKKKTLYAIGTLVVAGIAACISYIKGFNDGYKYCEESNKDEIEWNDDEL